MAFKEFHGGVDGYAVAALPFSRLCYLRDDQITIEVIVNAYARLLDKSRGTRYEIWTHESMALEMLARGDLTRARSAAREAIAIADATRDPGDGARAREVLAAIEARA